MTNEYGHACADCPGGPDMAARVEELESALEEIAPLAVLYDPGPGWKRFQDWASKHDQMLAGLIAGSEVPPRSDRKWPCKNQVLFEAGTPKEQLLYSDGSCTSCGARYHCSRCGIGTGMYGHNSCRPEIPPPPAKRPWDEWSSEKFNP